MALSISTQIVSSYALSAGSFTTDIAIQTNELGSFQVVWAGVNGSATVKLQGYLKGATLAANLTTMPSAYTLLTEGTNGTYVFNVFNVGYDYVRFVFAKGTTTTGSMNVYASKKGFGA